MNNKIVQVPSHLGMPHLNTDSGCPQQVFLLPSSDWTLLFDLPFTTVRNCNPAVTHKVLSLQFNWVKYVRISKNSVCVCFLLQPSHMTKWLIPHQPLKSKCRHNRWAWKFQKAVESPSWEVWKQNNGLGKLRSDVCFLTHFFYDSIGKNKCHLKIYIY